MAFGVFLIIAGIIIPFLHDTYTHNLLSGGLFPDFPVLAFGVAVAILGAVVIVIGLVIKNEPERT